MHRRSLATALLYHRGPVRSILRESATAALALLFPPALLADVTQRLFQQVRD